MTTDDDDARERRAVSGSGRTGVLVGSSSIMGDSVRTPTRPRKMGKYGEEAPASASAAAPITPGVCVGAGGGRRAMAVVGGSVLTPESVGGVPEAWRAGTPWTPVRASSSTAAASGGFDTPVRSGRRAEDTDQTTLEEDAYVYGTPPSSPRASDVAKLVCPRTPIKARRTRGVTFAESDSLAGDAVYEAEQMRPRGRVVRSLMEEFDAAERSLEDLVESRSDTTTVLRGIDFDPFGDP